MPRDPYRTGNLRRIALEMDAQGVPRADIADRIGIRRSYLYRIMEGVWKVNPRRSKRSAPKERLMVRPRAELQYPETQAGGSAGPTSRAVRNKTGGTVAGVQAQMCPVVDCVKADSPAMITLHCIEAHSVSELLEVAEMELAGWPLTSCIVESCEAVVKGGNFVEHYMEAHR